MSASETGPGLTPELSVVVGLISGRPAHLEACLEALFAQDDVSKEVLVPYDDPVADVVQLQERFPDVRFLRAEGLDTRAARAGHGREHHDTLRTIGLQAALGRIVALTEDHAVSYPAWCGDMVRLLDEHPGVAAIGGAVECRSDTLLGWAVYWCDFGRYQNPLPEGPAAYVSDSNVAYRREALHAIADAWRDDYHETIVHGALVAAGHEIWLTPRSQVWQARGRLRLGTGLVERFVWGRSFAGTRARAAGAAPRLVWTAFSFALPLLLTWRVARGVLRRRRERARFARTLPLVLLLHTVWAVGELVGYVTRDPGGARS